MTSEYPERYNKPILRSIYYLIYIQKINALVGMTGPVGSGKSHHAVKIGYMFDNKFNLKESLVYTVEDLIKASLKVVKYKGKELNLDMLKEVDDISKWIHDNYNKGDIHITPGKVIIFDEAGTGAYVRQFFSQDNRSLSKIIQIWRVLRMVVIFVVPEDMSLAESTISRFLNMEIRMQALDKKRNVGMCKAYKYTGWNKKKKQPYLSALKGCRGGGTIYVKPLPPEIGDVYESLSQGYKIEALAQMGLEYELNKPLKAGKTETLWDDVKLVQANIEKVKNEKGIVTIPLIQNYLGVSIGKAQQIRAYIASARANKQ